MEQRGADNWRKDADCGASGFFGDTEVSERWNFSLDDLGLSAETGNHGRGREATREREFAKFLDGAEDVKAFAKLPRAFGFAIEYTDAAMNLRNYEPDFVAIDNTGTRWLLESKGQENVDVARKDIAAARWCENATKLAGTQWRYVKVPQKEFGALEPRRLSDLAVFAPAATLLV